MGGRSVAQEDMTREVKHNKTGFFKIFAMCILWTNMLCSLESWWVFSIKYNSGDVLGVKNMGGINMKLYLVF